MEKLKKWKEEYWGTKPVGFRYSVIFFLGLLIGALLK